MSETPTANKRPAVAALKQRALVVGVSGYSPPLHKLPAVAADVREIAKLLASKNGAFSSAAVTVLTEKQATSKEVLAALRKTFSGAKADDTVFVYLAGHGGVQKGAYYFLAQDTDRNRLAETGVPLAEIKRLFDRTTSKRVFLWLDCCHSGGILPRARRTSTDLSVIRREIGVVQGEGKIILAACTPEQSAYEDPSLGHGLFTHALLRGLKGEAVNAYGEVTASSLYDFIDREIKHPGQQPVFSGKMAGRIVLMHYPAAGQSAAAASKVARPPASRTRALAGKISSSGKLLLLDGHIYTARAAREGNDGSWEVDIAARNADEEASLRSLRTDRYRKSGKVSFAFGNQGFQAEVVEVAFTSTSSGSAYAVSLKPAGSERSYLDDVAYNDLTPDQLAEMRARLLLLGEKPSPRELARDQMLLSFIRGNLEDLKMNGAVLPPLRKSWKGTPADFLRRARLWLVYYLKAANVCDDLLELTLGPERKDGLPIRFRGRRKNRYAGSTPEILVEGVCPM